MMCFGRSENSEDIDPEDKDLVFVVESNDRPLDELGAYTVGKNTLQKSYLLIRKITDLFITLITRRLDYIRYRRNYPPLFVFGESPLTKSDWLDYKKNIQKILPEP